jgi:phage terminase large subunit GpA-like protein
MHWIALGLLFMSVLQLTLPWTVKATVEEADWLVRAAKTPKLRSYTQFALDEIVLPNGPYKGARLKPTMQPATFIWLAELDKHAWRRYAFTAPVQSGKTLSALVIPLMHVLFERRETAILGAPKLEIAHDKWREDFLPVIKASRYGDLLPTRGAGSRGGTPQEHVQFGNGVTMKFMSGQGSDDSRSAFTSRWAFVTETDKMYVAGDVSREADPVSQIEDRTFAFDRFGGGYVFLECTCSVTEGRIWREVSGGTNSRIALPCPHCGQYVSPDREHFCGWDAARNEVEAEQLGSFHCPACGQQWSQDERLAANERGVLVHQGQTVDQTGQVHGDPPPVRTLGVRLTAANNAFVTDRTIAAHEWKCAREDEESEARLNLEKTLRQKIWAMPYDPPALDEMRVDWRQIKDRSERLAKGFVPADTFALTVGVDIGKRLAHWVAVAWLQDKRCHVVDYGRFDIAFDELGAERALTLALRDFRDLCESGWLGQQGRVIPEAVWIDSAYTTEIVRAFIRESGARYLPTIGRGTGQYSGQYAKPKTAGKVVREIGDEYHIEWVDQSQCHVVMVSADHWKGFVHRRMVTPLGKPGAMTLFDDQGDANYHTRFAKHLVSEKQVKEFVVGKGRVVKWVAEHSNNHWFDAMYLASAAGHFCGWSLVEEAALSPIVAQTVQRQSAFTMPDGRAFVALER